MSNSTTRRTKRDAVIEAASELIRERGVHATSVADIIAASGASAGTIYHHFENKNDIVRAVAVDAVAARVQGILADVGGGELSPGDWLQLMAGAVLTGEVHSALIVQLWAGSATDPELKELLRVEMSDARHDMADRIDEWRQARGINDPHGSQRLAELIVALGMGLLAERLILSDLDQRAILEQVARVLDLVASAPIEAAIGLPPQPTRPG